MRFRCLAFLEQQVEELERAEQDRMEERQVGKDFGTGGKYFGTGGNILFGGF